MFGLNLRQELDVYLKSHTMKRANDHVLKRVRKQDVCFWSGRTPLLL